jgi:prepilin-type N-terminal cleavage/methylation domain-containing protein
MRKQEGFSLVELLIVVAIILIIASIAIPSLLRSRMLAHQAAAANTIRSVNTAEATYQTTYPLVGYSATLFALGPPAAGCPAPPAIPPATNACLLDPVVACLAPPCLKGQYTYQVFGAAAVNGVIPDYVAGSIPLNAGLSGSFNYCSTSTLVIMQAPASAVLPATPAVCTAAPYIAMSN